MALSPLTRGLFWVALVPFLVQCTKNKGSVTYDLNLYSGIRQLVALGDAEPQVKNKVKFDFEREEYKEDTRSIAMTLSRLNITHSYKYSDLGAKVYFRDKRVVLIELQPPFKGEIQGKKMTLFDFKVPGDKTWEDILVRKLGGPVARASGGKFGSEALFYSWGDVSYNRMGLNQIALYRDPGISRYRQKNFGRDLKLFNN